MSTNVMDLPYRLQDYRDARYNVVVKDLKDDRSNKPEYCGQKSHFNTRQQHQF